MNGTGADAISLCLACKVTEACLPGGQCREGHGGSFCLDCWTEKSLDTFGNNGGRPWYKYNDLCLPCPTNTTLVMAVAVGGMFLFAVIMLRLGSAGKSKTQPAAADAVPTNKNKRSAAYEEDEEDEDMSSGNKVTVPFSILFTELQITMRFYELSLKWPQFVLDFIAMLGTVLEMDFVNMSMTDPACSFQFDSPGQGYKFRQNLVLLALPIFCLAIASLHLMFSCAVSSMAMGGNRVKAYLHLIRNVPVEVANACVTAFSTMYIMLISNAIESWHCSTRVREESHMDIEPQISCNFDDPGAPGSYFRIWIGGLAALLVYGAGFPLLMIYVLWSRNQRYVRTVTLVLSHKTVSELYCQLAFSVVQLTLR